MSALVPSIFGAFGLLSFVSEWLEKRTICVERWQVFPKDKFWRRVYIMERGVCVEILMYFKLPSWSWERDLLTDKWCWHRRYLFRIHRSGSTKWRMRLVPEDRP